MDLAEAMIKACVQHVLDECLADVEYLGSDIVQKKQSSENKDAKALQTKDPLVVKLRKMVERPLMRVTYTEAIALLQKAEAGGHKFMVDGQQVFAEWGMDL